MASSGRNICLYGAGRLGQAFAVLLEKTAGTKVTLWDQNADLVKDQPPLAEQLKIADLVILTVPTNAIRQVLAVILPSLSDNTGLVFVSKGLELGTGLTAAELATELVPREIGWAVFGGSMVAEEVLAGVKGAGVLAGDKNVCAFISKIFPPEYMTIEYADKPQDVSWCGVLKNIYATIFGLVAAMKWPAEKTQKIWDICLQEFLRAGETIGVEQKTIQGAAGLGDLRMTAGSPHSRNRAAGEMILTKHEFDKNAESVNAWPEFWKRFPELHELPLLKIMSRVFAGEPPAAAISQAGIFMIESEK